jgi:uncharacterized protein (DUF1800 family)
MSLDSKAAAALALHRFGLGPARDSIAAIASDPRGALLAELDRSGIGQIAPGNLPSSGQAARSLFEFRAERNAQRKLEQRAKKAAIANNVMVEPERPAEPLGQRVPPLPRQLVLNEAKARLDAAVAADLGFVERLVWFWSNHFCVSVGKIVSMGGAYEREAIRPHVLGRFVEMLQAVESHPAMLFYLDNVQSIGPNSIAGINRDRGLNENLAREIMELHTLGVRTGYSQADVTSFANVLTGWTWTALGHPEHGGEFLFVKRLHEPGDQTIMGKRYPDTGVEQGRAVLNDLAKHPATAKHIAFKLARYFVADDPPPALVGRLEKRFKDTDGNLKELARTLVTSDETWVPERRKLKRPSEWIVAALRLTGAPVVAPRILGAQALLGEPLWRPPAPNGFSDVQSEWIDGLPQRLEVANRFGAMVGGTVDPGALIDSALGPLASKDTRTAVARAESRPQALALLLMAPEFQRR